VNNGNLFLQRRTAWMGTAVAQWLRCCATNRRIAEVGSPDTTLAEPHSTSNTKQIKNETANVVVQQHSRKLLKMGILMPETC